MGRLVKRSYHFLSDLERDYFTVIEFFQDGLVDIKEQYPLLGIESTKQIALEYDIKHPQFKGKDIVMTSDFYITYEQGGKLKHAVRSIKPSSDLSSRRVLEKLAIEEEWWRRKGVENWKIITEKEIEENTAENIREVNLFLDLQRRELFKDYGKKEIEELVEIFLEYLSKSKGSIGEVSKEFDENLMLRRGSGLSIYKHLVAVKTLKVPLEERLTEKQPVEGVEICLK